MITTRLTEWLRSAVQYIPYWGFWLLLIYMPFHIFLAQSLSLVTGGLEVWKIGKDVVLATLLVFTFCLVMVRYRGSGTLKAFRWFAAAAGAYGLLHLLVWALHTDIHERSALLGIIYNNRLLGFAILGWGAYLITPTKFAFSSVMKIVLGVSTLVVALGLLQYVLPKDILMHFGYSLDRGARPAFFIDDHPDLPRIMSTLREPNALGAYLLLPVAALLVLLANVREKRRQYMLAGIFALHVVAILLTQSRSAWLAFMVVCGLTLYFRYSAIIGQSLRRLWPVVVGVLVVVLVLVWTQRNAAFFQEYIIHSNPNETVQDLDSNDLHLKLVKEGMEGVVAQPFGHGPGTAGLVSIQDPDGGKLTENYYVQIAYEIGWLGLALFIALNIWIYVRLWRRHDALGYVLCATFWGYVLTNMLLHTWSSEAVAVQWWLLAGLAMALPTAARPKPIE